VLTNNQQPTRNNKEKQKQGAQWLFAMGGAPLIRAMHRHCFAYLGPPNGPVQRPKPFRYVQYECYETTARSETRKLARVRPARCPAWGIWISGSANQRWMALPRRSRGQTQATRGVNDPPQGQLACIVLLPVC
jgi:hypothetical protein